MFRGRNQVDGKWVCQEFTDEEMHKFLKRITEFNKEAWKESVRAVRELAEGDFIGENQEINTVRQFFDKLGLQTFSVVNNQAQNMRK